MRQASRASSRSLEVRIELSSNDWLDRCLNLPRSLLMRTFPASSEQLLARFAGNEDESFHLEGQLCLNVYKASLHLSFVSWHQLCWVCRGFDLQSTGSTQATSFHHKPISQEEACYDQWMNWHENENFLLNCRSLASNHFQLVRNFMEFQALWFSSYSPLWVNQPPKGWTTPLSWKDLCHQGRHHESPHCGVTKGASRARPWMQSGQTWPLATSLSNGSKRNIAIPEAFGGPSNDVVASNRVYCS